MTEDTSRLAQRFTMNRPAVVSDFVDGEVVAVNLESGVYFAMFEGSALVWEAVSRGASLQEVADRARSLDDATRRSLDAFLVDLLGHDLLRPSDLRDADCEQALDAIGERDSLGPLRLHVHEDLQDMLLLDPVHDAGPSGWPESREA